jgi:sugar phosphate isomerase/epimerase
MSQPSRRNFVASASAISTAKILLGRNALSVSNLGVQLYTVRDIIVGNAARVLKAIQDIGYREIEATHETLDKIWPALQRSDLKRVSLHMNTALFLEGGPKLDAGIAAAKKRGFEYIVVPYLEPELRGGIETFKKLATKLNQAGMKAKAAGLTLCYHQHAFEFEPLAGTTGLAVLMSETQKDLVSLELDVFWASVAGQDPVAVLKKYASRIRLLHLKDKARGPPVRFNENVPNDTYKEVGNGSLDFPAILSAAKQTPVSHFFVEQDETAVDPIVGLRKSFKYLSARLMS